MIDKRNQRPLPPLLVVGEDRRTLGPLDFALRMSPTDPSEDP